MHIKVSNLITNSEILFPSRMTFFSNIETFHFVFTFSVNIGTTIVKLASTVEIKISTFVRVSKVTAFIFTVTVGIHSIRILSRVLFTEPEHAQTSLGSYFTLFIASQATLITNYSTYMAAVNNLINLKIY